MRLQRKPMRRPLGVVLISVYYFFSAGYTLIASTLARTGAVELDPVQRAAVAGVTLTDYLFVVLAACLMLSAAIALLWLRRVAFPLFCAALALTVSVTIWNILTRHWMSARGAGSVMGAAVAWTIMLLVCVYTARLRAQGILT
jgi:hypothetical protein